MRTITLSDGTALAYQDLGHGPAIVFSHGWPLSSDAWESQLLFFAQQGFRAIAHDRPRRWSRTGTSAGRAVQRRPAGLHPRLSP